MSLATLSPAGVEAGVDFRHFRGDREVDDRVVGVAKSSRLKLRLSVRFPAIRAKLSIYQTSLF